VGRYSHVRGRPLSRYESTVERFASSRVGAWLFVHVLAAAVRIVLVASTGGGRRHPGWLFNLRARPGVRFLSREHGWRAYRAYEASGEERERCWALAADFYAGYDAYAERTAREIGVVVLEPCAGGGPKATTRA
jgi:deazaflavin-dependent oxidoreductase (nitroreductase family)